MKKNNALFFKQNTLFGCLVGAAFIFTSILFLWSGKGVIVNPQFNNIMMMLTIFGIFMGIRKYRDEQLAGAISYGKALKTGIYILCIASLCYTTYVYFLYKFDTSLLSEFKNITQNMLKTIGSDNPIFQIIEENIDIYFIPANIAFSELVNRLIMGGIFALLIAALLRRNKLQLNS